MDATKKLFAGLTLVALFSLTGVTQAQNVNRDYVIDKYSQYSPFDHQNRGLVYKIHTGHAGLFGDCDDDRQKMISPYIDWHCRTPDSPLGIRFVREIMSDMFRKNQRLTDGAGACVFGRCQRCNGSSGECHCDEISTADRRAIRYPNQMVHQPKARPDVRHPVEPRQKPVNVQKQQTADPPYFRTAKHSKYESQAYSAGRMNVTPQTSIFDREKADRQASKSRESKPRQSRAPTNSLYSSVDPYRPIDERVRQPANRQTSYQKAADSRSRVSSTSYQSQNVQSSSTRSSKTQSQRFQPPTQRVPENRFEKFEKTVQQAQPQTREKDSRQRSPFRLSSGSVYSRPNFNPRDSSSKEPVQDRESDPRYFQFQRIGESAYR